MPHWISALLRARGAKEVQREDGNQQRQGGVEIQNGQGLADGRHGMPWRQGGCLEVANRW